MYFTNFIKRPTFYFEGADAPTYLVDAAQMRKEAEAAKVPFTTIIARNRNHFDLLDPLTRLLAR